MKLLVLTQNNCPYCDQVKNFLNDNQVNYDVINVSDKPEYKEKYDLMGAPTILLIDDGEVIARTTGYNPGVLETLIDQL